MGYFKFSGVLEEVKEQYPNIDIKHFLQQKLGLPDYKAEELAIRIEREYFRKPINKTERRSVRRVLEKADKSEVSLKTDAYSVDCLSEKEFEFFINWLFEELGYEFHHEKHPAYLGVDLVAERDGEVILIQARRYPKTYKVSNSIVLLSNEAKRTYGCQRSLVLSTAYFTQLAIADAQKLDVELWDRDTLAIKIDEVRKKAKVKVQQGFPQFKGSLLQSLLKFEETGDFIIEPRTVGKYDLHLPGVKFPLLTFQSQVERVTRCIFRIKDNKPVGEHEGAALISFDRDNNRIGPDEVNAYALIIQYLEKFLR